MRNIYLTLCVCLVMSTEAFAVMQNNAQIVDQALNCIENRPNDLKWDDICYTIVEPDTKAKKGQAVSQALDRLERRHKREDQRYQAKLESQAIKTIAEPEEDDSKLTELFNGLFKKTQRRRSNFGVAVGQRIDSFDWSIAGNIDGSSPTVLEEFEWRDLYITQLQMFGDYEMENHVVLDGKASYGHIYKGENRNSVYTSDAKLDESSRIDSAANDGFVLDLSAGIGYRFGSGPDRKKELHDDMMNLDTTFGFDEFWVTPLGGYSFHRQKLKITNGNQTIDLSATPSLGPFSGLDSTYETEWKGYWVGFEFLGTIKKLTSAFRFEYHWADYYAKANFNLNPVFQHPKSIEHLANGSGIVFNLDFDYEMSDKWTIDLDLNFQDWEVSGGIDRAFFASGARGETQLNEVNWNSMAVMLGATLLFN